MKSLRAWRRTPRAQDLARWYDAHASARYQRPQHRTISKATAEHHAHRQNLRQPSKKGRNGLNAVSEETAEQESDYPEPEFDWSLDKAPLLSIPEQEAQFERSPVTGKTYTRVLSPCPVCNMPHRLTFCPLIFEDNPRDLWTPKDKRRDFEQRMKESDDFRDAVEYMREKFTRRNEKLHHLTIPRSQTLDAPPLAREWLMKFDQLVIFYGESLQGTQYGWKKAQPDFSSFPGYFSTNDDDGRPFLILYANSGHVDEHFPYEIDMIRTFVAQYNRGAKASTSRSPDDDTRPIGVVIVTKRWHISRTPGAGGTPCITVGIASEYSWFHGYARFGIHIRTPRGRIEEGYESWASGRVHKYIGMADSQAQHMIDWTADSKDYFANTHTAFIAALGYGLLRDVREPPDLDILEKTADKENLWERIYFWRTMLLHRAATFYGTDSHQYKALYAYSWIGFTESMFDGMDPVDAFPRWKHIQSRIAMAGKPYEEQMVWRSILH